MIKVKKYFRINIFITLMILFLLVLSSNSIYATNDIFVIPGGDAIGLKIDTGIYVAGKYQVNGETSKLSPWKNSDILEGDMIISCNGITVFKTMDLNRLIQNTQNKIAVLEINRNNQTFKTNIDVVKTINGEQTIGLYVKDRLIGIGTLTFIDSDAHLFASLGHGINDKTITYGNVSGELVYTNIESIKKGSVGVSGEKRASLTNDLIGKISINSITGVYGKYTKNIDRKKIRVAKQNEIKKGPAKILTVIEDDIIESFDVEIIGINLQDTKGVKGIKIKVIDERLINKAGGIVQGMSGSPLIQNNALVGAVSHVSLEDAKIGYAMHIEWMLEEMEKIS